MGAASVTIFAVTPLSSCPDSDEAAHALGLRLQAEGADGVAHETLHDHDEGRKHAQLDAVAFDGRLHGDGGDDAAGEDGRADDNVVLVRDDEAADEVDAEAYRDAGYAAMSTVFHWSAKSRSLMVVPMWTSSMETSTPETSSRVESSNIVFGSTLVQKPARKSTEEKKSMETIALVFVGDHVAKTEDEQDDEYCEDGQHWSLHR